MELTMEARHEELIKQITSIGFKMDTDLPLSIQVESASDGVMTFCEYEEDDDGYFTSESREYTGTFLEALQVACDEVSYRLDIDGLTRDEAVELLLSPDYRTLTLELAERSEPFGGLHINGTCFSVEGGQLVNEDFGPWPFEDETD
jgi:hypothetical protein